MMATEVAEARASDERTAGMARRHRAAVRLAVAGWIAFVVLAIVTFGIEGAAQFTWGHATFNAPEHLQLDAFANLLRTVRFPTSAAPSGAPASPGPS